MQKRIALVTALAVTVVVGFVLLSLGATGFRLGQAEGGDRDTPSIAPVADLASGRDDSPLFEDEFDDDEDDWERRDYSSSPYSAGAYDDSGRSDDNDSSPRSPE